jgi:RNA 3'-terminal phosphate cyclase (ATP)
MTEGLLTIDGSQGEGGGQVLRSSLALSLVTSRPFTIEKIRAGRKKPVLLQKHLTAVLAAAKVGSAEVDGAALGSRRLAFGPGPVQSGHYAFRGGTIGSATLVLQTVLPVLLLAEGESNLVLEGGTHNPMARPVDFLKKAYLPLVDRLEPRIEVQLVRPGFYPTGGGNFTVSVRPAKQIGRVELLDRG